jgi:hypothetical protein
MTPWFEDRWVAMYEGDVRAVLRELPAESVHCVVTSPPYWGLRDYGTATWEGGDPECDHKGAVKQSARSTLAGNGHGNGKPLSPSLQAQSEPVGQTCPKCGARRIDAQLGLEPTPEEYVAAMVDVFREVRRVLRDDGTLWLNLGDSYNTRAPVRPSSHQGGLGFDNESIRKGWKEHEHKRESWKTGLKDKDLVGIPWMLAKALQAPYYTGRIKDERDRIWLAAMIEAEGCLFLHRRRVGQSNGQGYLRKHDSYGAGLEVSNTSLPIIERCMAIVGKGSISSQSPEQNGRRKQTIYRWSMRSNECREVIREVYPHFVGKRHQARLLLGCPSSGEDAERAHRSLIALHNGGDANIDFPEPESMYERGWFLRSDIVWSKLCPTPCPSPSRTGRPRATSTSSCSPRVRGTSSTPTRCGRTRTLRRGRGSVRNTARRTATRATTNR